jgi:hypothetical protein
MSDRPNFPDLPAWQKLRAELEPYQTNNQSKLLGYIDRIVDGYDDPTVRQLAFEELIDWLDIAKLIDNLTLALTPDLPSTPSTEQQARAILLAWLPDRIVNHIPRGVNVRERLKNWLDFAALPEWQKLQSCVAPYQSNRDDSTLNQLIDKAIQNYLTPQQFCNCIEAICIWMLDQPRIRYSLTGKTAGNSRVEEALATEVAKRWVDDRLEQWMRSSLASNFTPTGTSATKALIALIIRNLDRRIRFDLLKELNAQRGGIEWSLDRPVNGEYGSDSDRTYLDNLEGIADLQAAEKARRDFPIFVEFFKGLVDSLEATYQNCWEVRFANYVNQDSKFKLRSTFHVDAACNYQYLLQSLILPNFQGLPPKTITDICREFPSIGEHSLRSHITRTFYPWVDSIYLEILTEQEWSDYRDYLEQIGRDNLTTTYRKGFPTCNIFFLAQHRLPCFSSKPLDWVELAELISTTDGKKIKPEYVEKFWQEDCRPALGKIARREILEYKTA